MTGFGWLGGGLTGWLGGGLTGWLGWVGAGMLVAWWVAACVGVQPARVARLIEPTDQPSGLKQGLGQGTSRQRLSHADPLPVDPSQVAHLGNGSASPRLGVGRRRTRWGIQHLNHSTRQQAADAADTPHAVRTSAMARAGYAARVVRAARFTGLMRGGARPRRAERSGPIEPALVQFAELLAIGLRSGKNLVLVLASLEGRLRPPMSQVVDGALRHHERGKPLVDALDDALGDLGPDARRLNNLVASQADGAAIASSLLQWASDLRQARRLRVQAAARQLPVRMLAPLMVCVLPAFLLLTVVPLVLDGIRVVLAT